MSRACSDVALVSASILRFFFFFKSRIERNVEYDSDFYLLFIHEGKGKNKTSWFNAFGPDDDDSLVRRHVNK